jgi:hypothetical protein
MTTVVDPEVLDEEDQVQVLTLGITASAIMLLANHVKDYPDCRPKHGACFSCDYEHCPSCPCDQDCPHAWGCKHWQKCGINEATIFLMESLIGMTPEQAKKLLAGVYKLEGETASTSNPEGAIRMVDASLTFADKAVMALNSWTEANQKE